MLVRPGRKAQDGHLDFHTAPELWFFSPIALLLIVGGGKDNSTLTYTSNTCFHLTGVCDASSRLFSFLSLAQALCVHTDQK